MSRCHLPHGVARRATSLMILVSLAACKRGDKGVTISGDVAGLDSIALRGDSLLAQADRAPTQLDSLRAVVEGRVSSTSPLPSSRDTLVATLAGTLSSNRAPVSSGAAATRRAQARGDSMARASAMQFANGSTLSERARADSVRGIVKLQGTPPVTQPVLQLAGQNASIALSGMASGGLRRLEGVEVMVRGVRVSPRDIVVAEYLVRGVKGMPAYDGILNVSDAEYSLTLTDGSGVKRLTTIPSSLRGFAGTRVWVAMPAGSSTPSAYGLVVR